MTEVVQRSPLLLRAGAVPLPDAERQSADSERGDPDAAVAWHYGDPLREQRELLAGAAVTDLSHRGLLTITGPDRLGWLHSLTTQHLTDLTPMTPVETLILSPHGHVEHALHLVDDGDVTWVSTEPLARREVLDWLRGMRFRRKVQVEDVSEQWAAVGAVLAPDPGPPGPLADLLAESRADADGAGTSLPPSWQDPWPQPGPDTGVYTGGPLQRHPGWLRPWREIWLPRARLADAVADLGLAGSWAAEALRVAAWRPRSGRENDHRTLPHEADWLRTSLHLTKGCYRGQETVAKIYHLGKPPRRLVMLHLDGSGHDLPAHGDLIHGDPVHADPGPSLEGQGRPIGLVTTAARHHELGPVALALLKRNTPTDLALRVGDIAASQEVIVEL